MTTKTALPSIGAAVLGGAFQGVYAQGPTQPAVRSEMVVSTAWLEQHLQDRDLVVLYIGRDRGQFDSGHIPGSRFVRLDDLVEQQKESLNELPPVPDLQATFESVGMGEKSYILLTDNAGGVLTPRAYFTLDYLGRGNPAVLLVEGSKAWIAESRSMSKDEPPVARAEFNPHIHPNIAVTTARMRQLSLGRDGRFGLRIAGCQAVGRIQRRCRFRIGTPRRAHWRIAKFVLEEADSFRRKSSAPRSGRIAGAIRTCGSRTG